MTLVIAVIAVLAFLAWNRHLHNKEALSLVEKGGDWHSFLEMRERWRIRNGMLAGAVLLAIGVACLGIIVILREDPISSYPGGLGGAIFIAFSAAVFTIIGAIVTIAHVIWARASKTMWGHYRPTPLNSEEAKKPEGPE